VIFTPECGSAACRCAVVRAPANRSPPERRSKSSFGAGPGTSPPPYWLIIRQSSSTKPIVSNLAPEGEHS
jgi:hypothetical protein